MPLDWRESDETVVCLQAGEIAVSNEENEPWPERRIGVASGVRGRCDGARVLGVEGPMDGATTVGLEDLAARACISTAMSSALLSIVDLTIMIRESPPSTTSWTNVLHCPKQKQILPYNIATHHSYNEVPVLESFDIKRPLHFFQLLSGVL